MFVPLRPDAGDRRAAEWIGNEAALFSALSSGSRTPQDIVKGFRGTFNATYSAVDADPYFGAVVGASGVAALSRVSFGRPAASEPGTRDFTVASLWRCDNKRSGFSVVSKWNTGASPTTCDWALGSNGAGLGNPSAFSIAVGGTTYSATIAISGIDLPVNGYHYLWVGRRRGARLWLDTFCFETGRFLHSTASGSAGAVNANSARAVDLGEIDLGAAYSADVSYAWVAMDLAKWSDEQVDGLARDPMSVFQRRRRLFVVSAGGAADLVIADATHGHTSDGLTLTQAHQLAVADAAHAHAADGLTLTQAHALAVADATHAHAADGLVLSTEDALAVADGLHGHVADGLVLTQAHVLAVAQALHAHAADSPVLGTGDALQIAEAVHGHLADNLGLTQAHVLAVLEALHAHVADNVVFGGLVAVLLRAVAATTGAYRAAVSVSSAYGCAVSVAPAYRCTVSTAIAR